MRLARPSELIAQPLKQWKCTGKPDFAPEEQISGCSSAIKSGKLVGKDLAAAFTIRGSAYRVHGDLKRAVADYDQAGPTYSRARL